MLSKITLAGLYSYTDGSIFDDMILPDGIDRDILISEIIRQCSEFSVLYPDPIFMQRMVASWSLKWFHNFERWWKAYNFEYNALYNLEVEATYTENGSSNTVGNSSTSTNSTLTGQKSAYPSEGFKNATRDTNTSTVGSNGTSNTSNENVRTEKRFGNQGITMSQQMLDAEYNVWERNVYQMIAEVFAVEFCIVIYD